MQDLNAIRRAKITGLFAALALCAAPALAQKAPVHDCDRLAADPADFKTTGDGIERFVIDRRIAIPACEKAVQQYPNEARFHYQLGRSYKREERDVEAVAAFERAVAIDQNYVAAIAAAGSIYGYSKTVPADPEQRTAYRTRAFSIIAPLSAQGDAKGLYWECYYRNMSNTELEDATRMAATCMESASKGFVPAMLFAAYKNDFNNGDISIANTLYTVAAEKGSGHAAARLGDLYSSGKYGHPADLAKGVGYLRMAVDRAEPFAMYYLAALLRDGRGVRQDYQEAARLFKRCDGIWGPTDFEADPRNICRKRLDDLYKDGHVMPGAIAAPSVADILGNARAPASPASPAAPAAPLVNTGIAAAPGLNHAEVTATPQKLRRGEEVTLTLKFRIGGSASLNVDEEWALSHNNQTLPSYPVKRSEALAAGSHEAVYRQAIPAGAPLGTYRFKGEVCADDACISRVVTFEIVP